DVMGCGLAMVSLMILGIKSKPYELSFFRKPEFIFLVVLNAIFMLGLFTCVFALYSENVCDNTIMIMNQLENPNAFWQIHPYIGAKYHVLTPIEGMTLITLSCLFFMGMDSLTR